VHNVNLRYLFIGFALALAAGALFSVRPAPAAAPGGGGIIMVGAAPGDGGIIMAADTPAANSIGVRPAPKDKYSEDEYNDFIKAASGIGALAGCVAEKIYPAGEPVAEEAYNRLKAVFKPHANEDTEIGEYSRFIIRLMIASRQYGRYIQPVKLNDGKYELVPAVVDDESKCQAVEHDLKALMGPGHVLDVATGAQEDASYPPDESRT
jgi:hypothetical protein